MNKTTRRTFSIPLIHSHSSRLSLFHSFFLSFSCLQLSTRGGRRSHGQGPGTQTISLRVSSPFAFGFYFCSFIISFYFSRSRKDPAGSRLHDVSRCALSIDFFSFYYTRFLVFFSSFFKFIFFFYKNHSAAPARISFKTHPCVRWASH